MQNNKMPEIAYGTPSAIFHHFELAPGKERFMELAHRYDSNCFICMLSHINRNSVVPGRVQGR